MKPLETYQQTAAEMIREDAGKNRMHAAMEAMWQARWQLREQYEQTGKAPISRQNLNKLMKLLPRADEYYSLSAEATWDEGIGAYRSFFTLSKEDECACPPGFRRKVRLSNLRYYDGYGFRLTGEGRLWLTLVVALILGAGSLLLSHQLEWDDLTADDLLAVIGQVLAAASLAYKLMKAG